MRFYIGWGAQGLNRNMFMEYNLQYIYHNNYNERCRSAGYLNENSFIYVYNSFLQSWNILLFWFGMKPGRNNSLYCTIMPCNTLHFTAFNCNALFCHIKNCTALSFPLMEQLHGTALYCTILHCTSLSWIFLYCTVLHCTALDYAKTTPPMSPPKPPPPRPYTGTCSL